MRLGSVLDGGWRDVTVQDDRYLALTGSGLDSVLAVAAAGREGARRLEAWVEAQPPEAWRPLAGAAIGPPIRPGAIYAIGENYDPPEGRREPRRDRPLVYGKAAGSVAGDGGRLSWDRSLTANVDGECELAVVIGPTAGRVDERHAMRHVVGYTILNDVSSRDPWLDGDQWLLGKSMDGFCPLGPWIVTADALDPTDVRLGCTINGTPIQDGRTRDMRFSIAEIVAFLSRHLTLRPGDVIATGTPARLSGPLPPERHLEPGDVVTAWIEGIGELTSIVTG